MTQQSHYWTYSMKSGSLIPPHAGQNGHYQKNLETINTGNGVVKANPPALLVGM